MLVGIIGAGPAGCALSCFLAERGVQSLVFDNDKRPDLLVGESLVPAVMPHLRRLGIESEVAQISAKKYGAALRHPNGQRVDFKFRHFNRHVPNYSYNIPRPEFDRVLRCRAEAMGVRFVHHRAKVEASQSPDREIQLSESSLNVANLSQHPDILVDATGRHRLFSRVLGLSATEGKRDDVSYFAHYDNFDSDVAVEGQVVLSVIDSGWSWQIPLKNALSVGVVIDKKVAPRYGDTPEQRLENIINADSVLSYSGRNRQRKTKVMSYSNYQLLSERGFGRGWVLLGDAYGFVDPMLSPGLFMALESAALLDKYVFSKTLVSSAEAGLKKYCQEVNHWHESWDKVIEYFYDGRLLGLFEAGQNVAKNASKWSPNRLLEWHIRRVISSMVSGTATRSTYNQQALYYSCEHLLSEDIVADDYKIKSIMV